MASVSARQARRHSSRPLAHHRRQEAGPEAEALVQADVLGAVRKGVQPGMPGTPLLEKSHRGLEQPLGDTLLPEIGANRQRPEEPHAAPVGGEVGADEYAVQLGGQRGARIRPPARPNEVGVARKAHRIRHPDESPEGEPKNPIRLRQVALPHLANDQGHGFSLPEVRESTTTPAASKELLAHLPAARGFDTPASRLVAPGPKPDIVITAREVLQWPELSNMEATSPTRA